MNKGKLALVLLAGLLFWPAPASAYLDAGTGSMLLQLLLGGIAGFLVILKLYWGRLLTFFGLRHDEPPQVTEDNKALSEE